MQYISLRNLPQPCLHTDKVEKLYKITCNFRLQKYQEAEVVGLEEAAHKSAPPWQFAVGQVP